MSQHDLAVQYKTDENLRIRIETHRLYTVGPALEPAIDSALRLRDKESLLDVGTGPGDFPIRIRNSGHRGKIFGVDASPGMVAKARSSGADVVFLQADAGDLPFDDETFDVCTARHMLYHAADIPRALGEAKRVLKRGGKFLAVTNARDHFGDYRRALNEAATRLHGDVADAMQKLLMPVSGSFDDVNGPGLVESVFGNVSTTFLDAALKFESMEPPLRYFDSCQSMKGISDGDWAIAREKFAEVVKARLSRGAWVVSKRVVLIRAIVL